MKRLTLILFTAFLAVMTCFARDFSQTFTLGIDTVGKYINVEMNGKDVRISYYIKGPVMGLLFDVELNRVTDGQRNLDDLLPDSQAQQAATLAATAHHRQVTAEEVSELTISEGTCEFQNLQKSFKINKI